MRILVIDDDDRVRGLLRVLLEGDGHQVEEAVDGKAGLRALRDRSADVVLSDLFMPDVDGLEVIRELRRNFPRVGTIVLSGGGSRGNTDMLVMAQYLGADGLLYKPFYQKDLFEAVARAAEKARAREDAITTADPLTAGVASHP
jgi:two-component system response regulator (stage 0 sporulation protein F)